MDDQEFRKKYLGDYRKDERTIQLENRLLQYYKETENCSANFATTKWKEFKEWCAWNYSQEEINRAKRSVMHLVQ